MLTIPETGNFNLEIELSSIPKTPQADPDIESVIIQDCRQLEAAGATIALFVANEKVVDMLTKGAFEREDITTDNGVVYFGKLSIYPNRRVPVSASDLLPGARIVTSRGMVTYILDGIRDLL